MLGMPVDQQLLAAFVGTAFIAPELGQVWLQFIVLGALLIVLEFLVDGTVGVFGGRIGAWLRRRRTARRRLDTATGGVFIALGIGLAIQR